ncbi:MAG: Ig-like domain-containing protein [Flavobacteriaceae bacterium]|jgi:uncharacterized protein (DUF2141 family)|nr:Ig-like domain-containing protein [Flavobacteriaceae bacterium]
MRKHIIYILGILLILSVSQCAKRGIPTGGSKDSLPPVLIKANPPLNTVFFDEEKITLEFDEYIKLNNITTQLVTSPPLEPFQYKISPETTVSKKVQIEFLDSLKPNITYTFNFGSAIEDFNEQNPLTYFSYTFSTGPIIDSLFLEGTVKDAYEKETEEFISVHLYPVDSTFTDSTIYNKKPFYISNTLDSVYFKLQNLSAGTYEMIALKDEGKNYLFDQNLDKIGFFKEPVKLPGDSIRFPVLFKEIPNFGWSRPQYFNNHHIIFGYFGDVTGETIELVGEVDEDFKYLITKHTESDTLDFWYSGVEKIDSLVFNLSDKDSLKQIVIKPAKPKMDSLEFSFSHKRFLDFMDTLSIKATLPVVKLDESLIEIRDIDSVIVPFKSLINEHKNEIIFDFNKTLNDSYTIQILPNAVTDFWGDTNDTLTTKLQTKKLENYGVIILNIETDSDYNYFIELIDSKGKTVRKYLKNEYEKYTFNYLNPGDYGVRLVKDINENNKWDTGNYLKKIQPEEVIYMEGEITLRANWDQNETFIVKGKSLDLQENLD